MRSLGGQTRTVAAGPAVLPLDETDRLGVAPRDCNFIEPLARGLSILQAFTSSDQRLGNLEVEGAQTTIRWTKYAFNNWLHNAGPAFDTFLALEFLAFTGPDVKEGIASIREKRAPKFETNSPI